MKNNQKAKIYNFRNEITLKIVKLENTYKNEVSVQLSESKIY